MTSKSGTTSSSREGKHKTSDGPVVALETKSTRKGVKKKSGSDQPPESTTGDGKSGKLKRQECNDSTGPVETVMPTDVTKERKKRRKEVVEDISTTKTERKSKRRRREHDGADGGLPSEEGGKRKSEDGRDDDNVQESTEGQLDAPDPRKDTSLTDQARRALAYAFDQYNTASSWKFNKARQNWLIRNLWSDEAIPDVYVSLLTRYMADVRGGVRESLIQACRSALLLPAAEDAIPAGPEPLTSVRQKRARAVLDAIT